MRPLTVRSRWLARRAANGRLRPMPLRVRGVNVASVSFTPARALEVFDNAIRKPGHDGYPSVVAACEFADVWTLGDDRPVGWDFVQYGIPGSPDSALGIGVHLVRGRVVETQLLPGTPATSEGGGIRRRPILRARLGIDVRSRRAWAPTFLVVHAPPKRAPKARAAYLRRLVAAALAGDIIIGDLNVTHRVALRLLGRRVHSSGVLHVAVPLWIPSTASTVDVGSDHLAIDVTLWPSSREAMPTS